MTVLFEYSNGLALAHAADKDFVDRGASSFVKVVDLQGDNEFVFGH